MEIIHTPIVAQVTGMTSQCIQVLVHVRELLTVTSFYMFTSWLYLFTKGIQIYFKSYDAVERQTSTLYCRQELFGGGWKC